MAKDGCSSPCLHLYSVKWYSRLKNDFRMDPLTLPTDTALTWLKNDVRLPSIHEAKYQN